MHEITKQSSELRKFRWNLSNSLNNKRKLVSLFPKSFSEMDLQSNEEKM